MVIFHPVHLKLSTHAYFMVLSLSLSHSMWSNINSFKIYFMTSSLMNSIFANITQTPDEVRYKSSKTGSHSHTLLSLDGIRGHHFLLRAAYCKKRFCLRPLSAPLYILKRKYNNGMEGIASAIRVLGTFR